MDSVLCVLWTERASDWFRDSMRLRHQLTFCHYVHDFLQWDWLCKHIVLPGIHWKQICGILTRCHTRQDCIQISSLQVQMGAAETVVLFPPCVWVYRRCEREFKGWTVICCLLFVLWPMSSVAVRKEVLSSQKIHGNFVHQAFCPIYFQQHTTPSMHMLLKVS